MSGLDSLEDAPLHKSTSCSAALVAKIRESAASLEEPARLEAAGNTGENVGPVKHDSVAVSVSARTLPTEIRVDETAILRVADNIISNAVRHATSAVSVELGWTDGFLTLSVSDDGAGFGEAAPRATEPFWRGTEARSKSAREPDGHMGLGLYICSVLCTKHGGAVSVSDAPEGGGVVVATFAALSQQDGTGESPQC